ncbi:lL-diaminopimelate aminotransferase [Clostridium sp. CAG:1024]|jgi:LL-diaminopimelate aminotransferase|nr:lL-diaminopimelate aminotransferase [Clostridium sp. CAG:1024]
MFVANGYYSELQGNYLFREVGTRVAKFQKEHPEADIIRMGIGDVTRPLVPAVIAAMHKAVEEMGRAETFRGYGPDFGYDFLREAIVRRDYASRGIDVTIDEVFVSDGAKCDVGNIQELFSADCVVAVMDPVYPVYVDTNVMSGRGGRFVNGGYEKIVYMPASADNGFLPELPKQKVDVMYLCFPNNPTGMTLTREQLKTIVDYAIANRVLILYDSAYEAYISEPDAPHSIYEIEGARQCAIEFRSMSKTAGFTGTRCAYTVVPKDLVYPDSLGNEVSLNSMWGRRVSTKFNGVPYVTQRAAEAAYSDEGYPEIMSVVADYMENARIIRENLTKAGFTCYGGVNAPYIWLKVPGGDSWAFFDELLRKHHIVGTPGAGFGKAGEGYFRMTAFATRENTVRAMERILKG